MEVPQAERGDEAARAAEMNKGVNLHTEASTIRDWGSVCDHVVKRASALSTETKAFLKLFQALTETYKQYMEMCSNMRGIIAVQKEYLEVPDYHETAIHKGCDLIAECLASMEGGYSSLYHRLSEQCNATVAKEQVWSQFATETLPYVQECKDLYLSKESELQNTMHVYMQAAEHNDRGFFIVAKEYQRKLLEFQEILKTSTDQMNDAITKLQGLESEKKTFEGAVERDFIELVLQNQTNTKDTLQNALDELEKLSGENAWDVLVDKLHLYKEDGSTIFEEPVPNKAGALIKSWMERDMELTCNISLTHSECTMVMIVTRWGFVQIYKDRNDMQPHTEFYIYDYSIAGRDGLTIDLDVRQHQTFAPLKGVAASYSISFERDEDQDAFEALVASFQQTHAPQT